jgi:hypothetical protein
MVLLSNDEYTPATMTIKTSGTMAISSFRRSFRFSRKLIIDAYRGTPRLAPDGRKALGFSGDFFEPTGRRSVLFFAINPSIGASRVVDDLLDSGEFSRQRIGRN